MAFPKITEADLQNKGNVGKPDVPNLSTADMQALLDEIPRDVIIPKHNALVGALEASDATGSIGSKTADEQYALTKIDTTLAPEYESTLKALLTIILKELAALDEGESSLDFLSGVDEVVNSISDDETKLPSAAAIVDYVQQMGGGDMTKARYDANDDGVADVAMEELTNFSGTPSEGSVVSYDATAEKWKPVLLGKKLSAQTLSAGSTTLTFADASITTTSTIDIYADVYGIAPSDVTVTTGQAVLTFDPQQSAISVYLYVR